MPAGRPFYVGAAGHRLRAQWVGGLPAARALVFLHEGLGSIAQWRDFPEALCAATGLPGLIYERWGFGGSDPLVLPRPKRYLEGEAEASLPEVLAACGIERPILVGHSDGGSIALLFAAAFPQAPLGCICLAAHVFVEEVTLRSIRAVVERWDRGDLRDRLARHHGPNAEAMFEVWAGTWLRPDFRDWTMTARLPAVVCPLLVIQGEADEHGTVAQVEAIARGVSGSAETWLVPGCGHSPHLEAADAVTARAAAFIARLSD